MLSQTLFSESNGFVLFDIDEINNLIIKFNTIDLLSLFSDREIGTQIIEDGIAIPIFELEPEDYQLNVIVNEGSMGIVTDERISSEGWILKSKGKIGICGIGYFSGFDLNLMKEKHKILTYPILAGSYEVQIGGGFTIDSKPAFDFSLKTKNDYQIKFSANMEAGFGFSLS